MFNPECVTCYSLGSCPITDVSKILNHFVCVNYVEVKNTGVVQARCEIVNRYGESGLKALISPQSKKEA